MGKVMTVLGAIDAERLGHCQMHEHIFALPTPASRQNPALQIDDEAKSTAELKDYRAAGGSAILDAQPVGAGRDLDALKRISSESGVAIIAVTGYHLPVFYESGHWIFSESNAQMRERFLSELTEGVGHDGIRAGAVKAAIGTDGAAGRFADCLRAAAGAAARTKVPLILHTERGIGAVEAVSLCEREGLNPASIAVCHADRQADDFAPHEAIARTGAYLEYDTIARTKYHSDNAERALIRHMLALGYADRLLLSLDTTAGRLWRYGGTPGLTYILKEFIPSLRSIGVSQEEISEITLANPRRIFEQAV